MKCKRRWSFRRIATLFAAMIFTVIFANSTALSDYDCKSVDIPGQGIPLYCGSGTFLCGIKCKEINCSRREIYCGNYGTNDRFLRPKFFSQVIEHGDTGEILLPDGFATGVWFGPTETKLQRAESSILERRQQCTTVLADQQQREPLTKCDPGMFAIGIGCSGVACSEISLRCCVGSPKTIPEPDPEPEDPQDNPQDDVTEPDAESGVQTSE